MSNKQVKELDPYSDLSVRVNLVNLDELYQQDMESGVGFDITSKTGITKDKKRDPDGIFSNKYGTEDDIDQVSNYSCKCGNLKGRFYEGEICPDCNTEVKYNHSDIKKTGWIRLNDYYLINPLFYHYIAKIIGKKELNNIINYDRDIDKDGNTIINLDKVNPNNPYNNIGLIEFKEKFDAILDHFVKAKNMTENKTKALKFINDNKDKIFIKSFPVFSVILRPISILNNNMFYADINKKFTMFNANVQSINKNRNKLDKKLIKVLPLLYEAQVIALEISEEIIKMISGKTGHIRSNQLGNRINFSARCVIKPLREEKGIRFDNIKLPYITFLELYKFQIINLLSKLDNINISDAEIRWNHALTKFDNRIYNLCINMIKNTKHGVRCIINRNPTINYGSILFVKVIDIEKDIENYTMSISNNVLGLLAGDYDGDVLNIVAVPENHIGDIFELTFNPRYMIIDRNTGKFNNTMNLIKDQLIGLSTFNRV